MRLLYEWIKCDKNNNLEDCGINFSSEYKIEYDSKKRLLTLREETAQIPNNFYSIDKNNIISQITCLVGKNGSGKSSILKHIYSTELLADTEKYQSRNTVQVYEENNKIFICHNQPPFHIDTNLTNYEFITEQKVFDDKICSQTTRIFLTNDQYCYLNDHTTFENRQSKIAFTPYDIDVLKSNFFNHIIDVDKSILKRTDGIYCLNEFFKNKSKSDHFQNILYLILLRNLLNEGSNDKFPYLNKMAIMFQDMGKCNQFIDDFGRYNLIINKFSVERILQKNDLDDNIVQQAIRMGIRKVEKEVLQLCACYNYVKKNSAVKEETAYNHLLNNLKTEILFSIYSLNSDILNLNSLEVNDLLAIYLNQLNNISDRDTHARKMREFQYYKNANMSLSKLNRILKESGTINQEEISVYQNKALLDYLDEEIKSSNSFVLKYIWARLYCSAGERAFLNLFSWLNCIPYLQYLSDLPQKGINKNIILFIDEPDLYCHPEWQRRMTSEIINVIETLFERHNVQIIFSTHSPLFLSDIPNEHVVRISYGVDGKILAEQMQEKTFGANIFDLYNNSFFLDAFVGEFAQKKINGAIKVIADTYKDNQQITEKELLEAKKIVDLIGEPVLKNKLNEMLSYIWSNRGYDRHITE